MRKRAALALASATSFFEVGARRSQAQFGLAGLAACALAAAAPGVAEATPGRYAAPAPDPAAAPGVEAPELRTERSRSYRLKSGALVGRIFNEAVNYRVGDGFRPIDSSLVSTDAAGYAVKNAANDWQVLFPKDLADAPIRMTRGDAAATFQLQGASGLGVIKGATARYADVLPGVSADYLVGNETVKENLRFSDARTSSVSFSLGVSANLTPKTVKSGVALLDADGKTRMQFARPFLYDANGDRVPDSKLTTNLTKTASGAWKLTMAIDAAWLKTATDKGTVTLDPVVSIGAARDCVVTSDPYYQTTSFCADPSFGTGYQASNNDNLGLLNFDVRSQLPAGSEVYDAHLHAYVEYAETAGAGAAQDIGVHRLFAEGAFTNNATWAKRDATNSWAGGAAGPSAGLDYAGGAGSIVSLSSANVGSWVSWPLAGEVRGWVNRDFSDAGLVLRSETHTNSNFFSLTSSEGGGAPYIDVDYAPPTGRKPFWTYTSQGLTDHDSLSVNVASGNALLESKDVSIPGTGLSNGYTRFYNSVPTGGGGSLGLTWKSDAGDEWRLYKFSDAYRLIDASGAAWRLTLQTDGTYRAPGLQASLAVQTDGSEIITYDQSRNRIRFSVDRGSIGRGADWVEDRNGNRITYTYRVDKPGVVGKITDTQGHDLTVAFSAGGAVHGHQRPHRPHHGLRLLRGDADQLGHRPARQGHPARLHRLVLRRQRRPHPLHRPAGQHHQDRLRHQAPRHVDHPHHQPGHDDRRHDHVRVFEHDH